MGLAITPYPLPFAPSPGRIRYYTRGSGAGAARAARALPHRSQLHPRRHVSDDRWKAGDRSPSGRDRDSRRRRTPENRSLRARARPRHAFAGGTPRSGDGRGDARGGSGRARAPVRAVPRHGARRVRTGVQHQEPAHPGAQPADRRRRPDRGDDRRYGGARYHLQAPHHLD